MYTKTDEFPENFQKWGGIISDPKKFIAIFFALEKAILVMNFRKKLRKGGGHFRSEKFHCKFSAGATGLRKNRNIFFRKRGGGQRPFGNFPEIHPFWYKKASLNSKADEKLIKIKSQYIYRCDCAQDTVYESDNIPGVQQR